MFEIVKNAIAAGGYKLAEMQHKVKKLWVLGDLTEEQMDELLALAAAGASADAERPEVMAMLKSLSDRLDKHQAALLQLMGEADTDTGTETEYEPWQAWDGISDQYQKGAVVSHNGQLWQSEFDGQNVWEPGVVGTEALWVVYTEVSEDV